VAVVVAVRVMPSPSTPRRDTLAAAASREKSAPTLASPRTGLFVRYAVRTRPPLRSRLATALGEERGQIHQSRP